MSEENITASDLLESVVALNPANVGKLISENAELKKQLAEYRAQRESALVMAEQKTVEALQIRELTIRECAEVCRNMKLHIVDIESEADVMAVEKAILAMLEKKV